MRTNMITTRMIWHWLLSYVCLSLSNERSKSTTTTTDTMMVTMINNYHNDDDGFFILIDRSSQSINDHNYMMVTITTTIMTMTASASLSTEIPRASTTTTTMTMIICRLWQQGWMMMMISPWWYCSYVFLSLSNEALSVRHASTHWLWLRSISSHSWISIPVESCHSTPRPYDLPKGEANKK